MTACRLARKRTNCGQMRRRSCQRCQVESAAQASRMPGASFTRSSRLTLRSESRSSRAPTSSWFRPRFSPALLILRRLCSPLLFLLSNQYFILYLLTQLEHHYTSSARCTVARPARRSRFVSGNQREQSFSTRRCLQSLSFLQYLPFNLIFANRRYSSSRSSPYLSLPADA